MIQDDPSVIKPIFESLKQNFATGRTKDLDFREAQLRSLLRGMAEMEKKFHDALQKDIGANEFGSWLLSTSITTAKIKHNLENFRKWAKRRDADTSV